MAKIPGVFCIVAPRNHSRLLGALPLAWATEEETFKVLGLGRGTTGEDSEAEEQSLVQCSLNWSQQGWDAPHRPACGVGSGDPAGTRRVAAGTP